MTSKHSTAISGVDEWILSLPVSLVSRGAEQPESNQESSTSETFGLTQSESFAKLDRNSSCWRTYQICLFTRIQIKFSETWPRAGLIVNGAAFRLPQSVPITSGIGCGYWPTPSSRDHKGTSSASWRRDNQTPDTLPDAVARQLGIPIDQSGVVNPIFVESLMQFPIMWTDLAPLAMHKFREWLGLHGIYSGENNQ
jgi:hypothetical protein